MKTFKQFLLEAKKPHYWLALDIPKGEDNWRGQTGAGVVDQLKKGELHGVKGISTSKNIVRQMFHTTRNTILAMPADDVHKLNPKLRPINYTDPHEFTKNGMHDIHRVFEKEKNHRGLDQVMGHIFAYASRHLGKDGREAIPNAFNRGQEIADVWKRHGIYPSINSPEDFHHHVQKAFELNAKDRLDYQEKVKTDSFYPKPAMDRAWSHEREGFQDFFNQHGGHGILHAFGQHMHRVYGDEAEMAVEAPSFKVPKNTRIVALSNRSDYERRQKQAKPFRTSYDDEADVKHMSHEARLKELGDHYPTKVIDDHHYALHRVYNKREKKPKK